MLKNITNFHLRPFAMIFHPFESFQKQKSSKRRARLRPRNCKIWTFMLHGAIIFYVRWFFLIKIIEGHHRVSFETIYINLWPFWGFSEAKQWSILDHIKAENSKKVSLKLQETLFYQFKIVYLIKTIEGHYKLSSETICTNFWLF